MTLIEFECARCHKKVKLFYNKRSLKWTGDCNCEVAKGIKIPSGIAGATRRLIRLYRTAKDRRSDEQTQPASPNSQGSS